MAGRQCISNSSDRKSVTPLARSLLDAQTSASSTKMTTIRISFEFRRKYTHDSNSLLDRPNFTRKRLNFSFHILGACLRPYRLFFSNIHGEAFGLFHKHFFLEIAIEGGFDVEKRDIQISVYGNG